MTLNAVIDRMPFRKTGKVFNDPGRIGSEVMRAVFVNQNTRRVIPVPGITSDVITLLDDRTPRPELARQPLGKHQTREPGTDD